MPFLGAVSCLSVPLEVLTAGIVMPVKHFNDLEDQVYFFRVWIPVPLRASLGSLRCSESMSVNQHYRIRLHMGPDISVRFLPVICPPAVGHLSGNEQTTVHFLCGSPSTGNISAA
jgi:hypothetical protein